MPKNWKINRKQKYLQTCVNNRNNVCKIINNVQKYLKQTTSSMPKIITEQTCKERCEQTPKMYAAIQLKSEITLSGKQSMKLRKMQLHKTKMLKTDEKNGKRKN